MVVATLLFVAHLVSESGTHGPAWPTTVFGGVLACGPVALRHRAPALASATVIAGVVLTNLLLGSGPLFTAGQVAAFFVLHALISTGHRRLAVALTAALNLIVLAGLLTVAPLPIAAPLTAASWSMLSYLLLTALIWAFGEFIAARRAHLREVEERLRRAETERDRQARLAVAEERNRIARELHDVLAHSLSVMIAQADGASYALRTDLDLAGRATRTVADTGRTALRELRGLLDVLHDPGEDGAWTPQPDAAALGELVERVRRPDLPIRFELTGNVEELPTGLGLAVYRIVQEALTNVLKHGGGAAEVRVDVGSGAVVLDVADGGADAPHPGPRGARSTGNGLAGMRERAALYGGTLTAGARQEGGWRVRAELPMPVADQR